MRFKKILVPYDATPSSEKAFKKILPIIEKHCSKIILLTCVRDRATFGFFQTKSDKKSLEQEKKRAERFQNMAIKEAEKFELSITSKIVKSDLESESIIDYAKSEKVDLIVMSKTKLTTNAEKMYYNSTVEAVFKNAPCPFLYVP